MDMNRKMTGAIIAVMISEVLTACASGSDLGRLTTQSETTVEGTITAASSDAAVKSDTIYKDTDKEYTLNDGEDISIDEEGTYLISGQAKNMTVYIDVGDEDEVTLVLSDADITNDDVPCIYVKNAKKVIVETKNGTENTLKVTEEFKEGDDNGDAVIYSKDDLVLSGDGTLVISSADNAVKSNDDLKIKSGTYIIDCEKNALRANDDIEIEDGTITVNSCNDGIHAENDDDDTKGSILITGGIIKITAEDDAIHATTTVQIDDGTLTLTGAECIEATQITVNGGDINITASGDGINAAQKSSSLTPEFTLNGGNVVIRMGQGDTDGVDSNGNIYINGGTIDIEGQSAFDYDGTAEYNGGTMIVNGEETDTITNQFMGGFPGEFKGDPGSMPRGGFDGEFNGEFDGNFDNGFEGERGEMPHPGPGGDMNPEDFKGKAPDESGEKRKR